MKPLRYLSVCSGIEAATVAWKPIGWECAAVAEIEPHPCAVLAHRHQAARPLFMPQPEAVALPSPADFLADPVAAAKAALAAGKEKRKRRNAIKGVARLSPDLPLANFGDLERFKEWPDAAVDLLVGGTPCQAFSIAGFREGLADPRGNLALVYLAILERYDPEWFLWENVPGVLSSNGGRDFGSFLGGLAKLGYGFAYRVLDAQFVRTCRLPGAVPQRRRRVFVVGRRGDWRGPAAVLFDPACLRGDPPPRRRSRKDAPAFAAPGAGIGGGDPSLIANSGDVGYCLTASAQQSLDAETETLIAQPRTNIDLDVAHTLRAEGFDATEDGSGRGTPLIPVAGPLTAGMAKSAARMPDEQGALIPVAAHPLLSKHNSSHSADLDTYLPVPLAYRIGGDGDVWEEGDATAPLTTGTDRTANVLLQEYAPPIPARGSAGGGLGTDFDLDGGLIVSEVAPTVRAGGNQTGGDRPYGTDVDTSDSLVALHTPLPQPWAVRRLMPVECERLQGFEDGYTDVPWRGRKHSPDGPRYKDIGNSMAVNVMELLGERIELVRGLLAEIEGTE